jgi:hypothetical protein
MFRQIEGLPRGVFGFEVGGRVMRDEVDEGMGAFEATVAEGYDVALLIEYHADMAEDRGVDEIRFDNRLSARGRTQRFAFVGDRKWRTRFDNFARFIGCDARMFLPGQRNTVLTWLLEASFLKVEKDAG